MRQRIIPVKHNVRQYDGEPAFTSGLIREGDWVAFSMDNDKRAADGARIVGRVVIGRVNFIGDTFVEVVDVDCDKVSYDLVNIINVQLLGRQG